MSELLASAGSIVLAVQNREGELEDVGTSSPIALVLVVGLLIVIMLLGRSMARHLKKLPRSFDPADQPVVVPDSPAELIDGPAPRPAGADLLDSLRRAPLAIEPPRRDEQGQER